MEKRYYDFKKLINWTIDTYLKLREKVNWKKLTKTQAEAAIKGSLYTVVAYEDNEPVAWEEL